MATNTQRLSTSSESDEEEFHTYRLKIHDASLDDAGEWELHVQDKYGEVSTSCNINILGNCLRTCLNTVTSLTIVLEALTKYQREQKPRK